MAIVPEPVDIHVGGRIRKRRKVLGFSQEYLAAQLMVSYQQVQKYERGHNRVSASSLYAIGRALGVGVSFFFEGLEDESSVNREVKAPASLMALHEGRELAALFPLVASQGVRRQIVDFVRAVSDSSH